MIKPKFWYGWIVVFVCWFFYFVNVGFGMNAVSVMNSAMIGEIGMSRSLLGIGNTIFNLLSGLLGFVVGPLIAKKGAKISALIGTALIAIATLLLGFFGASGGAVLWMICYGVILGIGCCFGTALPAQTGVLSWHQRRRSTAMGITMTASALGGFTATPLLTSYIVNHGWMGCWRLVGILAIVNLIVIFVFLINKPSDIGQEVDNGKAFEASNEDGSVKKPRVYVTQEKWTVGAAMKKSATWLILVGLIGVMTSYIVLMNQGILVLMDQGFEMTTAALSISTIMICSLCSRLLCGWLGDRINPRYIWICALSVMLVGVFICTKATTVGTMYLFAALVGFGYGGAFTMVPLVLGNYYGAEVYPQVYGNIMPFNTIISALAPSVAGIVYDAAGAYTISMYAFIAVGVIGLVCVILARPPKMNKVVDDAAKSEGTAA